MEKVPIDGHQGGQTSSVMASNETEQINYKHDEILKIHI